MITYDEFLSRLAHLRTAVEEACATAGRPAGAVAILPVTKAHPAEAAHFAARAGFAAVGENRVQEAVAKRAGAGLPGLRWELIGHLQSNKARVAAETFDRIQSVDSPKLAGLLGRAAAARGRRLPVLLQFNAGDDPQKFGADPADAPALLAAAQREPFLQIDGLMTVAPLLGDPAAMRAAAARTFARLRELRDGLAVRSGLALSELSMGMTGDLREAIAAGSTQIRVGTALFGAREPG